MFEKDIELARLLVQNLGELESRGKEVSAALRQAQDELSELKRVRDEREQYLDVLSRAAALLKREDLRVESPETTEMELKLGELEDQMAEINQEAGEYRQLVQDLRKRAPRLLSAATGEELEKAAGLEEVSEETADETDEDEAVEAELEAEAGTASFSPEGALEAEQPAAPPTPPALDEWDAPRAPAGTGAYRATELDGASEEYLGRFNIPNLKRKEAYDHGRGAAYIIDANSVLERVPAYDPLTRGISEEEAHDELIRDFDLLGRELSGSFHLVFDAWFQPAVSFGNNVIPEFGTGENQGEKSAGDRRLREIVFDMSAKLRPVCVVTGDSSLAETLQSQGVHIIPLGEFFKT